MTRSKRVLVVDDSAVVRQSLSSLLSSAGLDVTVAADAVIAIAKLDRDRPDLIILDLEMPRMNGLTFLAHVMSSRPIPVLVCSALTEAGSDAAIEALERGAVDVISKPRIGAKDFLEEHARAFLEKILVAMSAKPRALVAAPARARSPMPKIDSAPKVPNGRASIVAIGASVGGTEAIATILSTFPPTSPATVVVQHMPRMFTAAYARRLDKLVAMHVKEAEHGDVLRRGVVLIARGDQHLRIQRHAGRYVAALGDDGPVSGHRPSVDALFRSVAAVAGADAVGVLLTGMGADGAAGLLTMRAAGAATIAQDEETCVVFGMPREAIRRGGVEEIVGLDRMTEAILARSSY